MPIENIISIATFLAGTTLGSIVGYFFRILIEHRLAKDLSSSERYFTAAQRFRDSVNEALTMFQPAHCTWSGCNKDVTAMRHFVQVVEISAKEFARFKGINKSSFTNKWEETKKYCSEVLVYEISSGDPDRSNNSKDIFLNYINELLSDAKPA